MRLFDLPIEKNVDKSNEWFTPSKYIEAARTVMGVIDLDPASCALANETVKASRYYTKEDDGLSKPWYGRVWLNPPYGLDFSQPDEKRSTVAMWVQRAIEQYQSGNIEQAILLTTSQNDAKWFQLLWNFPICFTDHHVRFYLPYGKTADRNRKTQGHIHGACFAYLGKDEQKFIDAFTEFGPVIPGNTAIRRQVIKPINLELWTA